jgi:hypothetical protein
MALAVECDAKFYDGRRISADNLTDPIQQAAWHGGNVDLTPVRVLRGLLIATRPSDFDIWDALLVTCVVARVTAPGGAGKTLPGEKHLLP